MLPQCEGPDATLWILESLLWVFERFLWPRNALRTLFEYMQECKIWGVEDICIRAGTQICWRVGVAHNSPTTGTLGTTRPWTRAANQRGHLWVWMLGGGRHSLDGPKGKDCPYLGLGLANTTIPQAVPRPVGKVGGSRLCSNKPCRRFGPRFHEFVGNVGRFGRFLGSFLGERDICHWNHPPFLFLGGLPSRTRRHVPNLPTRPWVRTKRDFGIGRFDPPTPAELTDGTVWELFERPVAATRACVEPWQGCRERPKAAAGRCVRCNAAAFALPPFVNSAAFSKG